MPSTIHTIVLPSGERALVDAADRELVEPYRWFALHSPHTTYVHGYRPGHRNERVLLHRVLLTVPAGLEVDHINRDGLDNRRTNLRIGTRSQNNGNHAPTHGYKGVSFHKPTGRWRAYINLDRRHRHLGMFDDPWSAAEAYNAAALAQWGEFAFLNVRAVA